MRKSLIGLLLILSMVAVACGNSLEGQEVIYFGAPATDGPDGQAIQSSFDQFTEDTGIIVTYVGSENFESELLAQIEAGNPPNIALWPQPGTVRAQAEAGNLIPLEDLGVDLEEYRSNFSPYLVGLGEVDGVPYGLSLIHI